MIIIRTGFAVNIMYKAIKPFIHEVTLAKFRFLGDSYQDELLNLIDADQLPMEYGGTAPNF